ncbi:MULTISPECIES: hypothetical protein [unclassified Microbacterium]|uniref:hypothetical protein n=1 Tax=unclassified Microbacterium TaxID=2609290 RepID=UPI00214B712B|nr:MULTISPECIES: hypothetical protein [unclassified Microbacterium]MCR2784944.1 hypothetical protein [Microbacterium sp. zg.B96]WIM16483.1 hypothetical protein QNO11_02265 [Microbacterium sp. zg-B96]
MNKTLKAATAATLLAGAFALAIPTAAHAAYVVPPADVTVEDATVAPGGVVELEVADDTFAPGSDVVISLTGENASGASLAFVKFAVETATLGTVDAAADGSLSADIRLPSNAIGQYTVRASGVDASGATVTAAVTVTAVTAGGDTLPITGGDNSALLGLWVGGGALLLAGGGLAVAGTVRRHRAQATA